jgi:hypothetical protein
LGPRTTSKKPNRLTKNPNAYFVQVSVGIEIAGLRWRTQRGRYGSATAGHRPAAAYSVAINVRSSSAFGKTVGNGQNTRSAFQ